jgi:hypothetical protein
VLVAVPENATDAQVAAAQKKAQGLAQRARSGEDFAKLVRENSDSPDRANGGAIGMRSADRYPPLFVEAVQSTAVNGIAGPVRSSAGFHVLKVLAKAQIGSLDATVTQTQVRHILLLNDPKRTTAQAVAQLAEFKRRVQAGTADFAGLARDNSQDASAKDGGDLGWSRPGQFVPEFEEAMDRLSPGQISDPVVSRFGVHLIQVVGRRDAKLSQSEQREAARACCANSASRKPSPPGCRKCAPAPTSNTANRRSPDPMAHIARKRFGQHFLSDGGIIDAIVQEIAPQPGDAMVEIGPGLAALTQPLVERLGRLTVIELDRDLAKRLREHPQLDVIESDVLKVDFAELAAKARRSRCAWWATCPTTSPRPSCSTCWATPT